MKKNNTDAYLIHIIIKKHIETISGKDDPNRENSYIVIQEIVQCLAQEFEKSISEVEKQELKDIMKKVNQELFNYLAKFNRYDHKILDSYVILEKLIGD